MEQYKRMLSTIMTRGVDKDDRTGTGTRAYFGLQERFKLTNEAGQPILPLVTIKQTSFKLILSELLYFLRGDSHSLEYLHTRGNHIWDEWPPSDGKYIPYGEMWRSWPLPNGEKLNQLADVIARIKSNPNDRRLLVSAWNPGELQNMVLPPCHIVFQFFVANGELSCQLYQRSCDMFLGVPFNIASYSMLTHMIANECRLKPGEFIWTGGDCHIYRNHFDQVMTIMNREPKQSPACFISAQTGESIFNLTERDICLMGYESHGKVSANVAV